MNQVTHPTIEAGEKILPVCERWCANVLQLHSPEKLELLKDHVIEVNQDGWIQALRPLSTGEIVEHDYRGLMIAPGFVDPHMHYPQLDVIGSAAEGLLPWLEAYTFPTEAAFHDLERARQTADKVLDELIRHGVTSASVYCTSHPNSVEAFMQASSDRRMAMMAGKVLQDRHSPDGLRDNTEQSLRDSQDLIERWHGRSRLSYVITPRFAPTSSEAQLRGCAELAASFPGVRIQSHVAENQAEIEWVRSLFPADRSYMAVYDRLGLLQKHSIWAHCIYIDDDDRALMREKSVFAAVCPSSNLFLGSGLFDFAMANFDWGLASDVGGGSSRLWWHQSIGSAKALGWEDCSNGIAPGKPADFVVIDPQATPLLQHRWNTCTTLEQKLFCLIVLGDDRHINETIIAGRAAKKSLPNPG
ncbi:MAG: guanine deaminase [Betaproteobacteria bacterium]|nr:guanine deaminase [Betaproteobacteria bacterium]